MTNVHFLKSISTHSPLHKLEVVVSLYGKFCKFELDTATSGNFLSVHDWKRIGSPKLRAPDRRFNSATEHPVPLLGMFTTPTTYGGRVSDQDFFVTKVPRLNLLGRSAICSLEISVADILHHSSPKDCVNSVATSDDQRYLPLQDACRSLCNEFKDIFKPELGCLKGLELEVKFQAEAKPVFFKHRSVPFALQEDVAREYDAGIARGIWTPVKFNDWGTPVVPVRKAPLSTHNRPRLRLCGDYSATVNPQLALHRHPLPLPDILMQKLRGGFGFTKIDLADAYNQIRLGPESRKRLALSTHRGVLLQNVLPFGITSAPGYFQQIMDELTQDLPGVAVYLDDLLVIGSSAKDHLNNLRRLLQRLSEKGLRCRFEKCKFAQPTVEYLGHLLHKDGIRKASKLDAVLNMPAPKDVSALRSFLGSVQFYSKFLPPSFSSIAEPLYRLTRDKVLWSWNNEESKAFRQLKTLLSTDNVLTYFDPSLPIGISCDASNVGIGAVLFHRCSDGSERPIANVSKLLSSSQRNYSQIQKEALSIIFALKKFYQYLFGREFILVTDHKPLLALFGPTKPTPPLAANRLARWALFLGQFKYKIEYRKTASHQNADALSRLPQGEDVYFDKEETTDDVDTVCTITTLSRQVQPTDPNTMKKESGKDDVLSRVMRFVQNGWPTTLSSNDPAAKFRRSADLLTVSHGCLFYGTRLVIPQKLRQHVLQLLHQGHFGIQRMKQLARSAVYWPNIDDDILNLCRKCSICGEQQNLPTKPSVHPWMIPEKPWSRVHIDHAVNFLGSNWLLMIDAYSKYPCIHATSLMTSKATMNLLEEDFAHFGYPHTIVSDNAQAFVSAEFQDFCRQRGIVHLTGAPYHPSTNGAAERLVQTFKKAMKKSEKPPKEALQEFLLQYRRTPNSSGFSPSELLNARQIRSLIDTMVPSPTHVLQRQQQNAVSKNNKPVRISFRNGDPCYAQHFGSRHDGSKRWVPATIVKCCGSRTFNVRVFPRGPIWRRHLDQLRPRYPNEDDDPGDPELSLPSEHIPLVPSTDTPASSSSTPPDSPRFGPDNPRRSKRQRLQPRRFGYDVQGEQ
uniref:Gypsy retrotransposon integrase-like protein 1 n=1 Tax=Phallusia mammillata TaxID=59560 RepID=A0A6F9DEH0_9ASCI|nr:uncharacterized protein K02A2.6-like [Phallusia mammillata]